MQMEWRYTIDNQKCENRLNIDFLSEPTLANLTSFAVGAWNWWENTYSEHISNVVNLREVVATQMGVQNGFQYTYAPDTTTNGQEAGGVFPNETSFCVSLHSGVRGRSARGRWFVAGIPTAGRDGINNLSSTYAESYRSALQTYIDAIAANNVFVSIVSLESGGIPRPGGPVYFVVESATVTDLILDSQRRRKPGFGA
jgi:hypothetical protein